MSLEQRDKLVSLPNLDKINRERQKHVTDYNSEHIFESFKGASVNEIKALGYGNNDAVILTTDDDRMLIVLASKGSLIGIKLTDQKDRSSHLAFREDISHPHFDLIGSLITGEDVIAKERIKEADEITIDPSSQFSRLLLNKGGKIQGIRPSFWTEEKIVVDLEDGSISLRVDRHKIEGVIMVDSQKADYINFPKTPDEFYDISDFDPSIEKPSLLPTKFIPPPDDNNELEENPTQISPVKFPCNKVLY